MFKSIILSVLLASLPLQPSAASTSTSEFQHSDHISRVKALVAVNGLSQANKKAIAGFKEGLLEDISSGAKTALTPAMKERFEAISEPICQRIVENLDDYTAQLIAPRLTSAEVEQLIKINTSPLGAKFISVMTLRQSFDHDKFDAFVQTTADEIVSAMKGQRAYTAVSFTYSPESPADTARQVFELTGNRRGLMAAVDDYFVYSLLRTIDADLPLSAMTDADKERLKPMIFNGKQSLVNRMENHFSAHLSDNFSSNELVGLTNIYKTPVVVRASDAVMATQKLIYDQMNMEFEEARTEFFNKYSTVD